MTRDLLLEIGTEEIPASYLPPALEQIQDLAAKELGIDLSSFSPQHSPKHPSGRLTGFGVGCGIRLHR